MIAAVERRKEAMGVEAELRGMTIAVAFVRKVALLATEVTPVTWTGVERSIVSLTPSWPLKLYPKVLIVPSAKRVAV